MTATAVFLVALATLASWFESQWWGLHLLVHFPFQTAVLSLALLALAAALRLPLVTGLAGLCLLAQVPALAWSFGTWPDGAAAAAPPVPAATRSLVVTTFNMGGGRVDEERFLDYLDVEDPDILLLQESYRISHRLLSRLGERFADYGPGHPLRRHSRLIFSRFPIPVGHRIRVARRSSFLVFRVDLEGTESDWVESGGVGSGRVGSGGVGSDRVESGGVESVGVGSGGTESSGRAVTVVTLHASNPTTRLGFEARNRLFGALAENLEDPRYFPRPLIVAGDFNTTAWSGYFETLTDATGLRDAARGQGLVATWPARLGVLGIGIDHILVSDDIEVAWIAAGPDLGSDHRPVTAWLKLRR